MAAWWSFCVAGTVCVADVSTDSTEGWEVREDEAGDSAAFIAIRTAGVKETGRAGPHSQLAWEDGRGQNSCRLNLGCNSKPK